MTKKKENKTVAKILNEKKPHNESKAPEVEVEADTESNVEIEELKSRLEEFSETVLRMRAENENLRKRHSRDLEKATNFANSNFAKDLMEVMENLHRALENAPEISEEDSGSENNIMLNFIKGIELTKVSLEDVFTRHEIKRVYPLGKKFDHNLHQAVKQDPSDKHESGTVIGVVQAGYTLKDRVLRPAMVIVAG